ncbi:MAG: efflux RND transporter permease subunit, partial [Armatimonadetes bacterium]
MRVTNGDGNQRGGFNLVEWSVRHPYVVVAFFLGTLVLGYLAIEHFMPKRFMPYVQSPMLGIVTEMPGLSAEEMETYFSSPIEQKMVHIKNVRYIRSTSQD